MRHGMQIENRGLPTPKGLQHTAQGRVLAHEAIGPIDPIGRMLQRLATLTACALILCGLSGAPALARQTKDPFSSDNKRPDANNTIVPAPPAPQNQLARGAWRKTATTSVDARIDFKLAVTPPQVRRGQTVTVTITGTPRPGYHTYPFTQRAGEAQDESQLSKWTAENATWFKALWPVTESDPQIEVIPGLGTYLEHKQEFTVSRDFLILDEAKPGPTVLPVALNLQVCNGNCVWGDPKFEVGIEISSEPALPLSPALQARIHAKQPEIQVIPVSGIPGVPEAPAEKTPEKPWTDVAKPAPAPATPAPAKSAPVAADVTPTVRQDDMDLATFILHGISWGLISLLTPCVFPMIPITVSYFLKQSHQTRRGTLAMAFVYSATIVVVLTAGGVLLMRFLQPLSQHWATNLVLGALFIAFALSLFGMFELRLPSSLANFTSSQENRGGLVGTMFMALTFTIISFACVAPFYGSFILLAGSAGSVEQWLKLVLGALAYSAAFASPFFLLALFPSLLRSLPKSGSWMNTIKVVMGFLELAAALKFLRAGELIRFGHATLLTYDFVLGLYVGLTLLCGLYLLSVYRLPHDDPPTGHLGVPRLLFSLVFLSLGFYLLPGLFKQNDGQQQRPNGAVFAWLDSFLLPEVPDGDLAAPTGARGSAESLTGAAPANHLTWTGNLQNGLQAALDKRKYVFLDFTGLT
jgi:thiol:disulfide interchange protein